MENLGFIRRLVVKLITKVQKLLLRSETELASSAYYALARLHFSLYFKGEKSLEQEILNNTEDGYKAAKRHGRLVINTLYKDSDSVIKRMVRAASRGSFVKNIILNAKI